MVESSIKGFHSAPDFARPQTDLRSKDVMPFWVLVMVLGLIATASAFVLVRRLEDQTARADFATAAEQRLVLLDSSIQRSIDHLLAVGDYFDATPSVTRKQFKTLVTPILNRQTSLRALSWNPALSPNEVKPLEDFTHKEGFPDFAIHELGPDKKMQPLTPRAEYFPVWFIEPLKGNEKAFGFDLGSNPIRMAALEKARRQARPVATARITLVQETGKQFGFLIFRPVYVNASGVGAQIAPVLPPEKEVGRFKGILSGVFRIGQMVEMQGQFKQDGMRPMDLFIFDQQGQLGEQLLYPQESSYDSVEKLPSSAIQRSIQVGGRTWIAVAIPHLNQLWVDRTSSWIALVGGLLLTFLVTGIQRQAAGRARSIEETVQSRTRELQDSEQQLIHANQEALEANRMKTVFLASMSHEFRTPMNAVLGLLHVLSRTPLDDVQKDYVSKISGAAKRLLRLIEDILDVSRIEAGKLSIEQKRFMIEPVLRDVLVAVTPKLHDKKVELILEIDPLLPAELIGDAMRLTQVLVNLLDNASKFTLEGQIILSLRSTLVNERRIDLSVSVKDSGIGMSAEECERLFQPFVQADSVNRKRFGGTGLGLAICRQLVELMGGEIHVESHLGEGTEFYFSIPLGINASTPLCRTRQEFNSEHVLILDSHAWAGESLEKLLKVMGVKVSRAQDVETARWTLKEFSGTWMFISENFPDREALTDIAQSQLKLKTVVLSLPGASTRDSVYRYEKPLLPHSILSILRDSMSEQPESSESHLRAVTDSKGHTEQSEDGLDQHKVAVNIRQEAQDKGAASSQSAKTPVQISSAIKDQLRDLKQRLSHGDPQAEDAARKLVEIAAGSGLEKLADMLLRQCNNFDFRQALAALETHLPPEVFKEI